MVRALNLLPNGKYWIPDFNNLNENKYRIWWDTIDNKLGCARTNAAPSLTTSNIGSRLLFKSRPLAEYCSKQFKNLWQDYLIINQE